MSKRKKLILAFIIVNFLILMGIAVMFLTLGIISEYTTPTEPVGHPINLKPLLLFFAGVFIILAIVELILGLFTYKGNKWTAISLLMCEIISWVGIFGAVAAIIELVKPHANTSQL